MMEVVFLLFYLCFSSMKVICGTSTTGGYYVNLLQFPHLCPLTSFCTPWNPVTSSTSMTLLRHAKIEMAVHGIHILRSSGRLRKNDPGCWNRDENSTAQEQLCHIFSDTGYVICDDQLQSADSRQQNKYRVPKRCVQWRTDGNHNTRAFYKEISLNIPTMKRHGINWFYFWDSRS